MFKLRRFRAFQKDIGLEPEQVEVLMKCFNGFCNEGVVHADTVGEILQMMGLRVKKEALTAIIAEVDEDGKCDEGYLLYTYKKVWLYCSLYCENYRKESISTWCKTPRRAVTLMTCEFGQFVKKYIKFTFYVFAK